MSKFKKTTFFRGKENYWSHTKKWVFPRITYSYPRHELVQLMASGIYQFWKYWLRDRKFIETQLKNENLAEPEPLALSSKVSFMYIVLIIGLLMAGTIFLTEHVHFRIKGFNLRQCGILNCIRLKRIFLMLMSMLTKCKCRYKIVNLYIFSKSTLVIDLKLSE